MRHALEFYEMSGRRFESVFDAYVERFAMASQWICECFLLTDESSTDPLTLEGRRSSMG